MARITAARPTDYATVTGPRLHNVFYPGEALTFALSVSGATGYEVRDHTGAVVATGSVSGTSLTLPSSTFSGKLGWWRLKLSGPDAGDGAFGTDKGTCSFVIFNDLPGFPQDPLRSSNPPNTATGQSDGILHGVLGGGLQRIEAGIKNASIRQGKTAYAASETSITATNSQFTGGASTSASMVYAVHTFQGSDLSGVGVTSPGWTLLASGSIGSLVLRVYQKFGEQSPATITCTSGTTAGEHCLVLEEVIFMDNESPAISPVIASGNGTSAVVNVDSSSLGSQEQYVFTAVARATGTGSMSLSGGLTDFRNVSDGAGNQRLLVSEDTFGTSAVRSITDSWSGVSDWISVYFVARSQDLYSQNLALAVSDLGILDDWYYSYADGVRERPKLVSFGTGTLGYEQKATNMVSDLAVAGQTGVLFEGRNEPNYSGFTAELQPLQTAVNAAGSHGQKTVASGFVTLCQNSIQTAWLACLDAGLADFCDVLAFHDYNMCNGDLRNAIRLYEEIALALSSRGITNPMLKSEGAHDTTWGGFNGAPSLLRAHDSGSAFMKNALVHEVIIGLLPEQAHHYYDRRNGFDSVTTWQSSGTGIYQGYAMLRTYTEQLRGKTLERRLYFGDGHYHYLGGVWSAPSRLGSKVAIVISDSVGLDEISCYISGDPESVTIYDCFGNATTVVPTAGVFALAATDTPQYIAIPDGMTFDVRPARWGPDQAPLQSAPAFSNTADPAGTSLAKMADGDLRSCYFYSQGDNTVTGSVYVDATGTFPKTITVTFPFTTAKASRLMVETPVPWQDTQGVLLDFDLQYQRASDGVWVTAKTFTHSATVTVKNFSVDDDTMYDCYTNPQTVWISDLGAEVAIKGVRLVVRDASAGMWLDSTMLGSYPLTKRTTIRAIGLRNLTAAAVPLILA